MINFLDTSAILEGALKKYGNIYISPLVLTELEKIKNGNYPENLKYLARESARDIINMESIHKEIIEQKKVNKLLKKYSFLSDINDHKILCEAAIIAEKNNTTCTFITCDNTQYLFAKQIKNLIPIIYEKNNEKLKDYYGWKKYCPGNVTLTKLYSEPTINILECKINEFAEIYQDNKLKDILFWDGNEYRPLKYKEIKNCYIDTIIRPRNLEQKMAFDLLQNLSIPVKLLYGVPGGGKDYLMLAHALDLIQKGIMNKIVFIRNLIPFKDAPEIGYLAGSLQEKIAWGMGPLASILGEEGLQNLEDQHIIEAVNLGFIRGMSWDNTIIYVSEGQNITGGGYKLLVSRCGKNSQLWVNGDILQTDKKSFELNNGIDRLINSLVDNKLFGMVKLLKSERSETAELAAKI